MPCILSSTTNMEHLETDLKRVRRNKVAIDNEEFIVGIVVAAIAVEKL
jgi:DNA-binding IclR family transcriptional regulator